MSKNFKNELLISSTSFKQASSILKRRDSNPDLRDQKLRWVQVNLPLFQNTLKHWILVCDKTIPKQLSSKALNSSGRNKLFKH